MKNENCKCFKIYNFSLYSNKMLGKPLSCKILGRVFTQVINYVVTQAGSRQKQ